MQIPRRKFTAAERAEWRTAIYDIYDRMRETCKEPREIVYAGLKIVVHPGVYDPGFFDDTRWFAGALRKIVGSKTLLEIGTGTGFIGLWCAIHGASVTATDINPAAVANARVNAARYRANMRVCIGDMYKAIPASGKYDHIFWAHPFNSWDLPGDDMLLRSGIDPGYESLRAYVAGAKDHLYDGGRLLLGTGDSADIRQIERIARDCGYRLSLVSRSRRPLGKGVGLRVTDLLCEFAPT